MSIISNILQQFMVFNVTTDWLVFKENERDLPNSLQLKFEAVTQMTDEDQRTVKSFIYSIILKNTVSQLAVADKR